MSKTLVKFKNGSRDDFLQFVKTVEPHHYVRIYFEKNMVGGDLNELLEMLPQGTEVRSLFLEGNTFRDKDLARLSQNSRLRLTDQLHIGNCGFTDRGLARFVQTPFVSGVKALYVCNRISAKPERMNQIGDVAAQAIARSPHLENLNEVNFWYTELGDAGLRALMETSLPRLSKICAWKTRVTREFHNQIDELSKQRMVRLGRKGGVFVQTDYNIPPIDYFGGDYDGFPAGSAGTVTSGPTTCGINA